MIIYKSCIYCGVDLVGKAKSREHVILRSLGGTRTIPCVCLDCNNDLSVIDKELASKSPLGIVAAQELGKDPEYMWIVQDNDLLLEARPDNTYSSMILWPQLVLDRGQPYLYCDGADLRLFGTSFAEKFIGHLCHAYRAHSAGNASRLLFEKLENLPTSCVFPPRIFIRTKMQGLTLKTTFCCRYQTTADRVAILRKIHTLTIRDFGRARLSLGSENTRVFTSYELSSIVRCLTKIGLNLLVSHFEKTRVFTPSFLDTRQFIRHGGKVSIRFLASHGFVAPEEFSPLDCPSKCHTFRLVFDRQCGQWTLYASFFANRAAATVSFPGNNDENWNTLDIVVPIRSSAPWQSTSLRLFLPLKCRPNYLGYERIIPSMKITHFASRLRAERKRPNITWRPEQIRA